MQENLARLVWIASGETIPLDPGDGPIAVGRANENDLVVSDPAVSRSHATLAWQRASWVLSDFSLHGTRVRSGDRDADKVHGRARALRHGDIVSFGSTRARFEMPAELGQPGPQSDVTPPLHPHVRVTSAEHTVLKALSAPLERGGAPASNLEIQCALHLSEDTVRSHLKSLYGRFDLTQEDNPRMTDAQRRVELANRAHRATLET